MFSIILCSCLDLKSQVSMSLEWAYLSGWVWKLDQSECKAPSSGLLLKQTRVLFSPVVKQKAAVDSWQTCSLVTTERERRALLEFSVRREPDSDQSGHMAEAG